MGPGFIATPEAVDIIGTVVESSLPDLMRLRRGVWASPISDEINAMVTVDHWKGATFSIGYGVSCSWIPYSYRSGHKMAWPTTLRQSLPHLRIDHFTIDAPKPVYISHLDGRKKLRRQAIKAVAQAESRARAWWRGVSTIEGVLEEARRQATNEFDLHHPRAGVVAAFTLARLDDLQSARSGLAPFLLHHNDDEDAESQLLVRFLEETPRPGA